MCNYRGQTPRCGSGWGSAGQCHTSPHSGWGTPAPEPVQARGRVDTDQEEGEVYGLFVCVPEGRACLCMPQDV